MRAHQRVLEAIQLFLLFEGVRVGKDVERILKTATCEKNGEDISPTILSIRTSKLQEMLWPSREFLKY